MDQWARVTEDRLDLIVWYFSTKYDMTESGVWIVLWFLIVAFLIIYLYYLIKVILSPFFWISDKKHEEREKVKKADKAEEERLAAEKIRNEEIRIQYEINEKRKEENKQAIIKIEENKMELTPEEFFEIREKILRKHLFKDEREMIEKYTQQFDCTGIYILYNKTRGKYYIGQSIDVLKRVPQHFNGASQGNQYVNKSYLKGDKWTIKIVPLQDSGFIKLNPLEAHAIKIYEAFEKGYNKTKGNK